MNSENLSLAPRRDIPADVLKCICCICVVVIHSSSRPITELNVHSFDWYCALFYGSLCRFAVPIFFMVTGALLLDPAKKMTLKKIYVNYFLRMLGCLLFWSLMYEFYFLIAYVILYGTYTPNWLGQSLGKVLTFNHHFHLYYLQILLLFYAMLPVVRAFVVGADRKTLRYTLIVWFILGVCFPFLRLFEPFASLDGIPAQYPIQMAYSSLGYGLLGYYIKTCKLEKRHEKWFILTFVLGFLGIFVPTIIVSHIQGSCFNALFESFTPPTTALVIGIYGWALIRFRDKTEADCPSIVKFSKMSFCVYLTHHFFVMFLREVFKYTYYCWFPLVNVPLQTVFVLVCCTVTYIILKRIPWVNRVLI